MNARTKDVAAEKVDQPKPTGLALMRVPFPAHQISKLPKPTKKQTAEVSDDFTKGIRCEICGGWHHPKVVHLDYVGHAALTDRMLDCDPEWNWEPVAVNEDGTPAFDQNGGMWIRLTVCGVTRLGYGHPDGKKGGDALKEVIGDALRNAAMRFGAALDLWHKGALHGADDSETVEDDAPKFDAAACRDRIIAGIAKRKTKQDLREYWKSETEAMHDLKAASQPMHAEVATAFAHAAENATDEPAKVDDLAGDKIPY